MVTLNITEINTQTALIRIRPDADESLLALRDEISRIMKYSSLRVITSDADLAPATDDLSIIARLRKALEDKRKEYVSPVNEHIKVVNAYFKVLTDPLEVADKTTRNKILAYRAEQEKKRQEAEEINRQKEELAMREAAFNGTGEITVDTTPVPVPEVQPNHVRTDTGTLGKVMVRKWEVEDLSKVPIDYLMIDATKVGKVVRAGIPSISGIRIWQEENLRVTTK